MRKMRKITFKELGISGLIIGLALLVTFLLYIVAKSRGLEFTEIAGDAVTVLNGKTLTGVYSNLGICLFGISTVLYFTTWYYLKIHNPKFIGRQLAFGFGLVSGMLYLDDFFMIHEKIVRDFLGIPEEVMMLIYFVTVLILIYIYAKKIRLYGSIYVLLSFGFLGLSAVTDVVHKYVDFPLNEVIEDTSKFIGICFWLFFALSLTRFIFHDEKVQVCLEEKQGNKIIN